MKKAAAAHVNRGTKRTEFAEGISFTESRKPFSLVGLYICRFHRLRYFGGSSRMASAFGSQ